MINSQIEYYRKLQKFLYLKELIHLSIENEINEGLIKPVSREDVRIAYSEEESNKPFEEQRIPTEEEHNKMPIAYQPKDKVRTGERIVLIKEKKKLRKELEEWTGFDGIEIENMNYSSLPKKHINLLKYNMGFRKFEWNGIEFRLNESQANTLEAIYKHFILGNKHIIGKAWKPDNKRDIVKAFEGSKVIGNILVKTEQGVYEINLDF